MDLELACDLEVVLTENKELCVDHTLPKAVIIESYQNIKDKKKNEPSPQTRCMFIRVPTPAICI